MKSVVKIVAATAILWAFASQVKAEEGYIRIGENCYTSLTMPQGYTYLVQVPCPRDISENS